MNDRIKQLSKRSSEYVEDAIELGYSDEEVNDIRDAMFAEFLIKECINLINLAVTQREPASTYVSKIKEHFGIKDE